MKTAEDAEENLFTLCCASQPMDANELSENPMRIIATPTAVIGVTQNL